MILTRKMSHDYILCIIFSHWEVRDIYQFLRNYGSPSEIGPCAVKYINNENNDQTFFVLHRDVFAKLNDDIFVIPRYYTGTERKNALQKIQRTGFNIWLREYEIQENNYPAYGENKNMYISLPNNMSIFTCQKILHERLCHMQNFGLVSAGQWNIKVRDIKQKTNVFINFTHEVELYSCVIIRTLLHDTLWIIDDEDSAKISCFWAQDRTKYSSKRFNHRSSHSSSHINNHSNSYNSTPKATSYNSATHWSKSAPRASKQTKCDTDASNVRILPRGVTLRQFKTVSESSIKSCWRNVSHSPSRRSYPERSTILADSSMPSCDLNLAALHFPSTNITPDTSDDEAEEEYDSLFDHGVSYNAMFLLDGQ